MSRLFFTGVCLVVPYRCVVLILTHLTTIIVINSQSKDVSQDEYTIVSLYLVSVILSELKPLAVSLPS